MAHVFIVDEKTFDIHLKYLFAGTGAKEYNCNYLWDNNALIYGIVEKMLTEMVADISRIRKGDKILFYLQKYGDTDGLFFGSFIVSDTPFLASDDYLQKELHKKLPFRVKINPYEVYENGITERDCLDSLEGINKPYELCWSLIYRKLRANRGCTMITDYEYEFIMNKIRKKNKSQKLDANYLAYDSKNYKIIKSKQSYNYLGEIKKLDIFNRLKYKYQKKNAYEVHLQAYLMQHLEEIAPLKVVDKSISWIGNEMSCGVGMQSIDVVFFQKEDLTTHIVVCELKSVQINVDIKEQLQKYVWWLCQYVVPNIKSKVLIKPTIVAPAPTDRVKEKIKSINLNIDNDIVSKTRYISFKLEDDKLIFREEK